mmetsp:Transcript_22837/g.23068  ORF Transcript_22837/g.23068 Transcript_22837/m.23068 type:complete len:195 (+) Transcript_22837:160-744(+)
MFRRLSNPFCVLSSRFNSSARLTEKKISAYAHFISNEKFHLDGLTSKKLRLKWGEMSDEEKATYAKEAAKTDPRVNPVKLKILRRVNLYGVFLSESTASSNADIDDEIPKIWKSLSLDDKKALKSRADQINSSKAYKDAEEVDSSAFKKISGYRLFVAEASPPKNPLKLISKLWGALTEEEKDKYLVRAASLRD